MSTNKNDIMFNSSIAKEKSMAASDKSSLNPSNPFHEEEDSERSSQRDREYNNNQRRMGRQFSINVHPSKDNKFYKVIIPYNFEKKKYTIRRKEIAFYENKQYLFDKLKFFCSQPAFDIEHQYKPKGAEKLYIYLPAIFLFMIIIYVSLVFITWFAFNPVVIYTLYSWGRKIFEWLRMFKFVLLEKFKMKLINKLLDEENNSEFCVQNKLRWILGQSGYWIEIQKLIE
jgi:hypothetical protein